MRYLILSVALLLLLAGSSSAATAVSANCKLQWTSSVAPPETIVTGYQIFLSKTAGTYVATPSGTATATDTMKPCKDFGAVTPGNYFVTMKALGKGVLSGVATAPSVRSAEVAFTIIPDPPPPPPTGIQIFEMTITGGTLKGTITLSPPDPAP